jgi:hypothetical protein
MSPAKKEDRKKNGESQLNLGRKFAFRRSSAKARVRKRRQEILVVRLRSRMLAPYGHRSAEGMDEVGLRLDAD